MTEKERKAKAAELAARAKDLQRRMSEQAVRVQFKKQIQESDPKAASAMAQFNKEIIMTDQEIKSRREQQQAKLKEQQTKLLEAKNINSMLKFNLKQRKENPNSGSMYSLIK
jgi:formylmethanofuran dehydrogenase subunit E